MSQPVGTRWFRKGRRHATSDVQILGEAALRRYLSLVEREEIALLRVRAIPYRRLGVA